MLVYILFSVLLLSPLVFTLPARAKHAFMLAMVVVAAVAGVAMAVPVLSSGAELSLPGPNDLIFGFLRIAIDSLSSLFIIIVSITAVAVAIYAGGYISGYPDSKPPVHISLHYFSLVVLFVSMLFVVMFRDAYGFLFAWELMTISSFLLILFDAERKDVRKAALSYLVIMHVGFFFLLAGFTVAGAEGAPVSFDSLGVWFAANDPIPLFLIFLVGFGMKAGIFPLHTWLPEAHPAAPAHISAFMSGVMIKMGVYGILRVISYMEEALFSVGLILFVTGIITGLWGAILAAVQNDIKRLLAYSSIENIGIIFTAMGASALGYATGNNFLALCAMAGALLHTVNHSFFKTILFFGAGNVYTATHTTSLDALGGIARRMPATSWLFLTGVAAICALPPLSGFVSEFLLYYGLLDAVSVNGGAVIASICGIVALSVIGGVVLLAFTKLYGIVFLGSPRSHEARQASEVGAGRLVACAIPVAGILLVGFAPFLFTGGMFGLAGDFLGIPGSAGYYAQIDSDIWRMVAAVVFLVAVIAALYVYRTLKLKRRQVGKSPVWGCGFTATSHRMQYSGESFSEGLYGISTSLTKSSGKGDVVNKDEIFPTEHSFNVKRNDKVQALFSRWWGELVRTVNARILKVNTGKVNHYILYALLFFALILLLSITGVI